MEDNEDDKPEEPTPFKLKRARDKGQVARGSDIGFFGGLAAFVAYAWIFGPDHAREIAQTARAALVTGASLETAPHEVLAVTGAVTSSLIKPLAIMGGAIFVAVLATQLAQTGFLFSTHPLKPDFKRLNPAQGLKRLFSAKMLIETLKNLVKMVTYTAIGWFVIVYALEEMSAGLSDGRRLAETMAVTGLILLLSALAAALAFSILDQLIVRRDFMKKMRMSRRELKREMRDREGEPRMKQRRKQLHGEFVQMSESVRNLKSADVLIVNPDHYAVGLRYDREAMTAPMIVARGTGNFALKLKRIAFIFGVTTIARPELARKLFGIGCFKREIPDSLYREVADIYRNLTGDPSPSSGE
ncbi:MAG: EscU/YscU/HrcU family type III secretion system export apparatus switch protein [Pseudomonadota bacterium]